MAAVDVLVAEAIKDEIAGAGLLSPEDTLRRSWADFEQKLEGVGLTVDVVPFKIETELESRSDVGYAVWTDILIRRKFGTNEQDGDSGLIPLDTMDAARQLSQDVYEKFIYCQSPSRRRRSSAGRARDWARR